MTTTANRTLAPIHDRMPVVVAPDAFDLWLDGAHVEAETAAAAIAPAAEDLFEYYEVSTAVNRVANDDESLIAPVVGASATEQKPASKTKQRKRDDQPTLF